MDTGASGTRERTETAAGQMTADFYHMNELTAYLVVERLGPRLQKMEHLLEAMWQRSGDCPVPVLPPASLTKGGFPQSDPHLDVATSQNEAPAGQETLAFCAQVEREASPNDRGQQQQLPREACFVERPASLTKIDSTSRTEGGFPQSDQHLDLAPSRNEAPAVQETLALRAAPAAQVEREASLNDRGQQQQLPPGGPIQQVAVPIVASTAGTAPETPNAEESETAKACEEQDEAQQYHARTVRGVLNQKTSGNFATSTLDDLGLHMPEEPERDDRLASWVQHKYFKDFFLFIIALNIFYSVHSANRFASTLDEPDNASVVIELMFTFFFTSEVVLKLLAHRCYFWVNEDWSWNIFDFVIVVVSVLEALALVLGDLGFNLAFVRAYRVLRVLKVFRIFRAFQFLSELRLMVSCLVGSVMPLIWCTVMIILIILVAALVFIEMLSQHRAENRDAFQSDALHKKMLEADFLSVGTTMMTLYQMTTGGRDWGPVYNFMGVTGVLSQLLIVSYVTFFVFAFLNIITSIFVDRVMSLAQPDREEVMLQKRRTDKKAAQELKEIILKLNTEGDDATISEEELMAMHDDPEVMDRFEMAGLDIHDVHMFFGTLSKITGEEEIDIDTFVEHAFQMKGTASSLDVQVILFQVQDIAKDMKALMEKAAAEQNLAKDVKVLMDRSRANTASMNEDTIVL